jgi:glycogen debranching enzyme
LKFRFEKTVSSFFKRLRMKNLIFTRCELRVNTMKKLTIHRIFIMFLTGSILSVISCCSTNNEHLSGVFNGLSNSGKYPDKPYLTAGDKSYIVGFQDGSFPDMGGHVEGEMGGFWTPSLKLLDGIWLEISEAGKGQGVLLDKASEFVNYPQGNRFVFPQVLSGIDAERFQFCPQNKSGMVIYYTFKNSSDQERELSLNFIVKTDLSPVWFSRENSIIDASDSVFWNETNSAFCAFDVKNPWYSVWGSTLSPAGHSIDAAEAPATKGQGRSANTTYILKIKPGESITSAFTIAGSDTSMESALIVYNDLKINHKLFLNDKISHYKAIDDRARVEIPDKKLQEAYAWGKINCEWLVSDLNGIGRFMGAGAIEYPWLFGCDNSYSTQGLVCCGNPELAVSTLRLIKEVSEKVNGNGRIIHEMSSNGFVGNKGNTQETPHFAIAVWKVFQWTGDIGFLKEMYPYIKLGINWLLTDMDSNQNLFPEGYGIMEVRGLNAELIDVAVYTQQALEVASKMARILNEPDVQLEYSKKAEMLKDKINTRFWDENEGSYCDFYGTREQAIHVVKGAIEQLSQGVSDVKNSKEIYEKQRFYSQLLEKYSKLPKDTSKGWFTNKNWVISTPVETGIAPKAKAIRLLDKVKKEDCGPYGPYLSAVEGRYMMTIATGVQAVAEARYGRTDEALSYIDKIAGTFGMALPGSISEMMPDYGCPVQGWTIYGLAYPLVTNIFGIEPDAYNKSIVIEPHLPANWDTLSISSLPVGKNIVSLSVLKSKNSIEYEVSGDQKNWNYVFPVKEYSGNEIFVNGKIIDKQSEPIVVKGKKNKIRILF